MNSFCPVSQTVPKTVKPCTDKQPPYTMLLAPFQPATRIELETDVNTNIECCLNIKNTSDKILNVTVTKVPAIERQITLSLSELEIQGNSNGTMHIRWSPREAGCWRDVLQLTDNRRIKYDIVIATTAKDNKKKNVKTRKKPPKASLSLSSSSNFSVSIINKPYQQSNTSLKVPTINQSLVSNLGAQTRKCIPSFKNESNKENIYGGKNGTKTHMLQIGDNKIINETHHYGHDKSENSLFEQSINVWSDGSVLPQALLPSNVPQDIRRATYVKERKPCNNVLYEHSEQIKEQTENTVYTADKAQTEFSMLLDKLTFTSVDVISSSLQSTRRESIDSTISQSIDKHRTFNISRDQFFDTFAVSDTRIPVNAPSALQSTDVCDSSLIESKKEDGCSLISDMNNFRASSPINSQHNDLLKDPTEYFKRSTTNINRSVQTSDYEYFSFEIIPENVEATKETGDMYIEISPPKKPLSYKSMFSSKLVKNTRTGKITKNKSEERNMKKLHLNDSRKTPRKTPAIKVNKLSLSALRKTKWHAPSSSRESSFRIQNKEESFIYEAFDLDPFSPSVTEDPFLKNTIHYDERWLLQQELTFTKWLNALLSSPEDLSVDIETAVADIGKVWQSCKVQKDTVLAETKEAVSARYHTNTRLNMLRKAASAMFNREEVAQVLSRTSTYIAKGTLCIRSDRNLHRDIGLQKLILGLFLNYNPLWLRIGLETIYGESIPLRSNNDMVGLTRFLLTRFFSDPRLIKMPGYHKVDPSQKFVTQLNQFILKKFLFLVYFLDYAKQRKLIGHDPCLFHKRAQHKESREILLSFSRELLSGIGDVTKLLRAHNYVLAHRQTYIEEYDYAVVDIRRDLRDGVRLCRVMELVTGTRGLTQCCRVPAISRLQKVHNADVALNALRQAGYVLEGDIDAKSIADGHCEKTLSLLWQIIHKYQVPRFDRGARVLQRWWRAQLWYINVRNYLRARRNLAAIIIQRVWRRKVAQSSRMIEIDCDLEEHKCFLHVRMAAICIQRWWRRARENPGKLQELRKRRRVVIMLQTRWRATLLMREQRNQYRDLKKVTLFIQARWRATRAMKLQRFEYLALRDATVKVQSWWRSIRIMQTQREWMLHRKESARIIQTWWRSCLLTRRTRNNFLLMKAAVQSIERWWMSVLERKIFLLYRKSAVLIQKTWRKYRARKREAACAKIQAWWRSKMCSRRYSLQKCCCVKLQRWWRGVELTRRQRAEFLQLRHAALTVQKNRRARTARRHYLKQRQAISLIQSWYRRANSARTVRRRYLEMRGAAMRIQNWWRNVMVARRERRNYLRLRDSAILLQTHWRRRVLARADRQLYLTKRKACITLQSWWRMIRRQREYRRYKACVLRTQRRWRATRAARAAREEQRLTRAVVAVQARWRALTARRRFVALRQAAIIIQSCYRMHIAKRRYEIVKYAVTIIQAYWRAYNAGKRERMRYLSLRQATITVQRRYRQKRSEREELLRRQQEDVISIATKIQDECGEAINVDRDVTTKLALPDSDYWQEMISVLRNCASVGTLLTCLSSLDTITKLSPTVCVILCKLNLADDIYNTIAQNNRSLPWMKVCVQACSILITLAKYPYTRKYIVKKEYALSLIKLLSGSLKDKNVFLHCATLIWLLSQDEDYSKAIVTCPQINWLMKNIQHKILKGASVTKSKDLEKLYPSCEPHQNNVQKPRLFTDMSFAVAAIIKSTYT
ncbi:Protein abnormal spindle [Ooceraea biroi]|uniref:Protein abnormal spindle n=1 Tax=Ooceraea biroi TaxID=2015173 RepID=A0A026WUG7_OOCBI|nr:Protein abnormal spindle [Ooceraea biroi]